MVYITLIQHSYRLFNDAVSSTDYIQRKGYRGMAWTEAVVARLLIYPGIRLAVLWWPVHGPILEPGTFRTGSTITMARK
jgi:hypothetical protein